MHVAITKQGVCEDLDSPPTPQIQCVSLEQHGSDTQLAPTFQKRNLKKAPWGRLADNCTKDSVLEGLAGRTTVVSFLKTKWIPAMWSRRRGL